MKAILALVGIGGGLFCGLHALALIGLLASTGDAGIAAPFGPTRLLAHVAGGAFGLLVAVVCFGKRAGKPAADVNE